MVYAAVVLARADEVQKKGSPSVGVAVVSAEKRVNKILSNESAREILKAHAVTAMNSAANQRQRGYSSQLSIDSVGSVPDLTDRVVRVSFAPTGDNTNSSAPAPDTSSSSSQQEKEKDSISIGLYLDILFF